jgi:hypothetical protein
MAEKLDSIDVSKLTVDELRKLKNEAIIRLRQATDPDVLALSHQNHSSHSDHSTAAISTPPSV